MATLLLRSAGSAVGTLLGGPLGGLVGGAIGAVGGAVVDNLLVNALTSRPKAPQLDTIAITSSNEGTPVRKLWGRMRLGGNVIWASQFQTYDTSEKASSSGKGFGDTTKVTHYALSFAVAFCEGGDNVTLGRVWADGNELDLSQYGYGFYNGAETQFPDSFIESIEGTGGRAGLSRPLLHGLSVDVARCLRQPHAADHGRTDPPAADSRSRRHHQPAAVRRHAAGCR